MIFIGFIGHAGLALAIAIGACINAALLFHHLKRSKIFVLEAGWMKFLAKIIFGLVVMSVSLLFFKGPDSIWLAYSVWEKIYHLCTLTLIGLASYFISLRMVGINLTVFTRRLSKQ